MRQVPSDIPPIPNPPVFTDEFRTRQRTPAPSAADSLRIIVAALSHGIDRFQEWDSRLPVLVQITELPGGTQGRKDFLELIADLRDVRICLEPEQPCPDQAVWITLTAIDVEPDYHEYATAYFAIPRREYTFGDFSILEDPIRQWHDLLALGVVPPPARSVWCCRVARSDPEVGYVWLRRRGAEWESMHARQP